MLLGANRINLRPRDGEMCLFHGAIALDTAGAHFTDLLAAIAWRQETARIMGRLIPVPRLSAWYGEGGYRFSGIQHLPAPMPDCLLPLQVVAEEVARCRFNSVLLNLYRDGRDSVSWHSDDEAGLGPIIASISLGATRRFLVRHKQDSSLRLSLDLTAGSCLIMEGMQERWLHCVPKAKNAGPRINLTFRRMALGN